MYKREVKMKANEMFEQYLKIKKQVYDSKEYTEEQITYFLRGWLECATYVINKENEGK